MQDMQALLNYLLIIARNAVYAHINLVARHASVDLTCMSCMRLRTFF